jgi:NADP-dependent 3-hydroxy acid dehydrogenase YdfG
LKNILITGTSSGIGKETALHFAKNGWNVIATMICLEEGKALRDLPNIYCYLLDVTSSESIEAAKDKILQDFKTIDVIINNAGIGYRSFVELSEDSKISSIVNINWLGVVKVCRAFIPVFREQNHGHFIMISSIAGLVNLPLGSFYHSTKQAVESFSECMAYELLDFNIKVCTVQFGNAPTSFQKNVTKSETSSIASYNRLMQKVTDLLHEKTKKNTNLTPIITQKLLQIAENPTQNFKRYTIGFDANAMRILRAVLGYRLFNSLIRRSVLK